MQPPSLRPCLLAASIAICSSTFVQAQMGGKITELRSGGRSFWDEKPDVAHDPITGVYAHVWQHHNGTNYDVWLKLFNDTPPRTGGANFTIASGVGNQMDPCVAYIAKTGMFLVAWQDDAQGNWDIMCRAYDPNANSGGATITVAATAADEITPDIAGEATKLDDDAVLVWDDESVGIRAVEIEVPSLTVKVLTPIKTLAPGAKPLNNNPAVSRSGGAARRIAMVWQVLPSTMNVTAYTMDLAAASTPLGLSLTNSFPEVDGDGSQFLIVFQRPDTATPNLGDIWCYSVKVPLVAALSMTLVATPRALAANANQDEKHPTVAFVGGSYLAAWSVVNTIDLFGKCRIQTLTPDCSTCGNGWLIQFANRQRFVSGQAIASEYNSDAATTSRKARLIYDTGYIQNGSPAFILQQVHYEVVGGPKNTIVAGCGTGGSLSIPGPFSFGENVMLALSGADPNATNALFVLGIPGARMQFPCGTCRILLGPFIFGVAVSGGQAQWSARIPCDAALLNLDGDFQYVVLTPGTSPCPAILPGLSTSNILRATIQ